MIGSTLAFGFARRIGLPILVDDSVRDPTARIGVSTEMTGRVTWETKPQMLASAKQTGLRIICA